MSETIREAERIWAHLLACARACEGLNPEAIPALVEKVGDLLDAWDDTMPPSFAISDTRAALAKVKVKG